MKSLKIYLSIVFVTGQLLSNAQDSLTIENAIAKAITNNFDIQLSHNNLKKAENNRSIYNSGYLPTATGTANGSYSNRNNFLVTQQGQEATIKGAETINYGGSLGVNYVIYNGGKRKNNFEKLKVSYNLADNQKKQQIDNTIQTVYITYYNLARAVNQKDILKQALAISSERLERVTYQFEQGQKSNLDVLNAKVDVNNDSLNIINSQVSIDNFRRNLNFLLGQKIETNFNVTNYVEPNKALMYSVIEERMFQHNYQLKQVEINTALSEYDLKVSQSDWKPTISANASYGINNNDFGSVGFYSIQNSSGLSSGVNLSWNLFDGGSTKTRVQNAKINIDNQGVYKEQLNLSLSNELATIWADYTNQLAIISSEKLNIEVNQQNFLKTKERFNLGQLTSLDFRQAQLNLINSELNLSNAMFNVKLSEIKLKRLEGSLVEQL
jgi:outer membrane protein TolC